MKRYAYYLLLILSLLISSCSPFYFYQVAKVTTDKNIQKNANALVYEDMNCTVTYDLWRNGGNAGFQLYNKSDSTIYVDLGESFFILNGIANDYYKNRVYSESTSSGTIKMKSTQRAASLSGIHDSGIAQLVGLASTSTKGTSLSSTTSVLQNEQRIVCIPPRSSKYIAEYSISESAIRDCDLLRFPTKKGIKLKSFTKENSPLVFSNRISYKVGDADNDVKIDNSFFVSEVCNYPESEVIEWEYKTFCGENSALTYKNNKLKSFDSFFIKYSKDNDPWKH